MAIARPHRRQRCYERRGTATVEFAVCLPIIVVLVLGAMQDEATLGTNRSTKQHWVFRRIRIRVVEFELFEQSAEFQGQWAIYDDPERAVVVMFTD